MDLDGDGRRDVLSGSWPGEVFVFRGLEEGGHAKAEKLLGHDGKPINLGNASVVCVVDWNADGALDLLVGNIKGEVHLVPGAMGEDGLSFAEPVKLAVADEPIVVPGGDSGPCAADWDGDGRLDLLVGCGDGSVRLYLGEAKEGAPMLAASVDLVAAPPRKSQEGTTTEDDGPRCGTRAKVAVFDWDGDGRLDLLMGDFQSRTGKAPELTEEQQAEKAELEKELQKASERMQEAVKRVREASTEEAEEGEAPEAASERFQALLAKDEGFQATQASLGEIFEKLGAYRAPHSFHGFVHVFLRQAPASVEQAAR